MPEDKDNKSGTDDCSKEEQIKPVPPSNQKPPEPPGNLKKREEWFKNRKGDS